MVAFRMTHSGHFPLCISGTILQTLMCTDICSKYSGLHIKEDITGTFPKKDPTCLPKKALVSLFLVLTDWSKPSRPRNKGTGTVQTIKSTKAVFLVQLCTLMMFLPLRTTLVTRVCILLLRMNCNVLQGPTRKQQRAPLEFTYQKFCICKATRTVS